MQRAKKITKYIFLTLFMIIFMLFFLVLIVLPLISSFQDENISTTKLPTCTDAQVQQTLIQMYQNNANKTWVLTNITKNNFNDTSMLHSCWASLQITSNDSTLIHETPIQYDIQWVNSNKTQWFIEASER